MNGSMIRGKHKSLLAGVQVKIMEIFFFIVFFLSAISLYQCSCSLFHFREDSFTDLIFLLLFLILHNILLKTFIQTFIYISTYKILYLGIKRI